MWSGIRSATAIISSLTILSMAAQASDHLYLDNALGAYVTPRGQKYFQNNLEEVLFRAGYSFSDGGFPGFDIPFAHALDINNLPPALAPYKANIQSVYKAIKDHFSGYHFNNPKLDVALNDIQYSAQFDSFGAVLGKSAKSYGATDGVVIVANIVMPKLQVSLDSVIVKDNANLLLQKVGPKKPFESGVNHLRASLKAGSIPLAIQVPILFRADARNGLEIRVLGIRTTLDRVTPQVSFDEPLIMPKIKIFIDDQPITVDQKALEDELAQNMDTLLKMLQGQLNPYIQNQGVSYLNGIVAGHVKDGGEEIMPVDPPGLLNPTAADSLRIGVKPQQIELMPSGQIHLALAGFAEDPKVTQLQTVPPVIAPATLPIFDSYDPSQYDVAVSLNQQYVNRLLQLSFERGYFEKVPCAGVVCKFVEAPRFVVDESQGRSRVKLHLKLDKPLTSWTEKLAVKSPARASMDMNVHFARSSDGGFAIMMDGADENSIQIDPGSIKFGILKSLVDSGAKSLVHGISVGFQSTPMPLLNSIPVPAAFFGVPLKILDLQSENSGNIMLYLEYGE